MLQVKYNQRNIAHSINVQLARASNYLKFSIEHQKNYNTKPTLISGSKPVIIYKLCSYTILFYWHFNLDEISPLKLTFNFSKIASKTIFTSSYYKINKLFLVQTTTLYTWSNKISLLVNAQRVSKLHTSQKRWLT